jgi:hypothetical protein
MATTGTNHQRWKGSSANAQAACDFRTFRPCFYQKHLELESRSFASRRTFRWRQTLAGFSTIDSSITNTQIHEHRSFGNGGKIEREKYVKSKSFSDC